MNDDDFLNELQRRISDAAGKQADKIVRAGEDLARAVVQLQKALEPFQTHLRERKLHKDQRLTFDDLKPIARAYCYENPEQVSKVLMGAVTLMVLQLHLEKAVDAARNLSPFQDLLDGDDAPKEEGA